MLVASVGVRVLCRVFYLFVFSKRPQKRMKRYIAPLDNDLDATFVSTTNDDKKSSPGKSNGFM